jgi:hypothetical protein
MTVFATSNPYKLKVAIVQIELEGEVEAPPLGRGRVRKVHSMLSTIHLPMANPGSYSVYL